MHTKEEKMEAFGRFLDILDELRIKCPWDKKQTYESLRTNTIEEVYELSDALMKHDMKDVRKELGDVLLHVAFYAKIASETGDFDIKDVCDSLCEKLIFRHPHVFGNVKAETAGQVSENWEQLKLKEKDGNKSVLSGVPTSLPSRSVNLACISQLLFFPVTSTSKETDAFLYSPSKSVRKKKSLICVLGADHRKTSLNIPLNRQKS